MESFREKKKMENPEKLTEMDISDVHEWSHH